MRFTHRTPVFCLGILASLAGCGYFEGESNAPSTPASDSSTRESATTPAGRARGNEPPEGGTWYILMIRGQKIGYERVAQNEFTRDGSPLVRIEGLSRMGIRREGRQIEVVSKLVGIETPDGKLVEFDEEMLQGRTPIRTAKGHVEGNQLHIKVLTMGKEEDSSIPWSDRYGGFVATEQSLKRNPMKPGETRTVEALAAGFNVLGTTRLTAVGSESVELLGGSKRLLRIDLQTGFPDGNSLKGTVWTDPTGDVLKYRMAAMNIVAVRATRAQALEQKGSGQFDMVHDVKVPVDRPLTSPHETKRVRYRVTLSDNDPASVFVSGPSQQVRSINANSAELTVVALRPGSPMAQGATSDDRPTDADRGPNSLIQSDYPAIVARAGKIAGDEKDPWKTAIALERGVGRIITRSDYSQAFATAAEVIDSGRGDCTEHAVLLAALARAREIPARIAMGLVYVDQAFFYHMWTEVYVGDRWIPLDATRARGGIGAAHLKMAHSSLQGASALTSFLPIMQVIGQLKIQILDVE